MADGICGGVVPVFGSCPVCGGESDRYLLSHRRSGRTRLLRGSCCSNDHHRGAGSGRTTVPGIWSRIRVLIMLAWIWIWMWLLPLGSSPDTDCGSAFSTVIQNTRRIVATSTIPYNHYTVQIIFSGTNTQYVVWVCVAIHKKLVTGILV